MTYKRYNFYLAFASLGGLLGVLGFGIQVLFSSYLQFSFDKSLMKRLYKEEADPDDLTERDKTLLRTDKEEFIHRINN